MTLREIASIASRYNDDLRRTCIGDQLRISPGVRQLRPAIVADALMQMRMFDEFTPQNDPYEHHDFGTFETAGHTFFFMIEQTLAESGTARDRAKKVCKLMLSDEY